LLATNIGNTHSRENLEKVGQVCSVPICSTNELAYAVKLGNFIVAVDEITHLCKYTFVKILFLGETGLVFQVFYLILY